MRAPKDIKIGDYTLEEILERHKHWLNRDCENWESMQADLCYADLRYADLCYADLCYADLRNANLCYANMSYANLRYANMRNANVSYVDMRNANVSYANMSYANICSVDMRYANMRNVDMRNTNMMGVDMIGTNMSCVDMSGVDRLRKGIKLSEPIIGWKKCNNNVLVKLEIPRGAIVFSINNKKCRTDKAKVLEIIGADRAYSNHKFFSYYVGDIIEVFNFNCEYNVECAEGIHFFKTRKEAENY